MLSFIALKNVTDLVKSGKSCRHIAQELQISLSAVYYRIERYEKLTKIAVKYRGQDKIPDDWIEENIIIPRNCGWTLQVISDILSISKQRVAQLEAGWSDRQRSIKLAKNA